MDARQVIFALLVACAGPRPSVAGVAVTPSPVPGDVRVTGSLANRGGRGTVELVITLRGPTTLRADRTVELDDHQRIDLAIDVAAPPGDYTATVTAEYPN